MCVKIKLNKEEHQEKRKESCTYMYIMYIYMYMYIHNVAKVMHWCNGREYTQKHVVCTWDGHLSADLEDHLSLGGRLAHGTDDTLVRGVHHRVSVDVCNLIPNLEPPVNVSCSAWYNGSNSRLERERERGRERGLFTNEKGKQMSQREYRPCNLSLTHTQTVSLFLDLTCDPSSLPPMILKPNPETCRMRRTSCIVNGSSIM